MKVQLVRRWGPYRAGRTVDVDDVQGAWLVQHSYARSADIPFPEQTAAAEGVHGADPVAGGDATRRRPRIPRPEREEGRNLAMPAPGSSPTFRGGYDAEARLREGEAGRNAQPSGPAADVKKPARRRTKSST